MGALNADVEIGENGDPPPGVFGPAPGEGFPSKVAFLISLSIENTFFVRFGANAVLEPA